MTLLIPLQPASQTFKFKLNSHFQSGVLAWNAGPSIGILLAQALQNHSDESSSKSECLVSHIHFHLPVSPPSVVCFKQSPSFLVMLTVLTVKFHTLQ
jgi:hypothetical protein